MANRRFDKAQEMAREHGARLAKTPLLPDEVRLLRDELAKAGGAKARAAASSPSGRKAFEQMEVRAEAVQLGPSPMVFPQTSPVDFDGIRQVAKEISETKHAAHAEKRDREQRMIQTLEAVRAELAASGAREAETLARAETAEGYNASMRNLAIAGLVVAVLAIVIATSVSFYIAASST